MTKISTSEHVLALLRAQLERGKKAGQAGRSQVEAKATKRHGPISRVRSIAVSEGISKNELSRALVSGLLLEHFGEEIVNSAEFQALVDAIVGQLRESDIGHDLLTRAVQELLAKTDELS